MKINEEPIINVGIQLSSLIEFELKGNFEFNGNVVPPGVFEAKIDDIQISTSFAKNTQIVLNPVNFRSSFVLKNVTIGIGFHWEQIELQEFEGGLVLQIEEGKIRAINTVPLETYLKSVISSEMSAMNDLNLLKAHAIVSRSWLLAQIQNSAKKEPEYHTSTKGSIDEIIKWYDREDHKTFDVCADDHCQRYQGITKVLSENAQNAVEATRGMVLYYNSEICDARFSKCCGGITEDFYNVWQALEVPYLTSVVDNITSKALNPVGDINTSYFTTSPGAFCNTSDTKVLNQVLIDFDRSTNDFFRWNVEYSQKEIAQLLKRKSGIDFGDIINLIPIERGKSGRIIKLKISGSKTTVNVGKELEIRKWLSESHLYSSAFIVNKQFSNSSKIPSKFVLTGAGWGHGVGMCQIGAAVMSKNGYSADQILKHYFSKAEIQKLF